MCSKVLVNRRLDGCGLLLTFLLLFDIDFECKVPCICQRLIRNTLTYVGRSDDEGRTGHLPSYSKAKKNEAANHGCLSCYIKVLPFFTMNGLLCLRFGLFGLIYLLDCRL